MSDLKEAMQVDEILQLTEEMVVSSGKSAMNTILKPHGYILNNGEGAFEFMADDSTTIYKSTHIFALLRSINDMSSNLDEVRFVTGVMWGYYKDPEIVSNRIRESYEDTIGLTDEMTQQCVAAISAYVDDQVTHLREHHGRDDVDKETHLSQSCWITGCFIGKYYSEVNKISKGL